MNNPEYQICLSVSKYLRLAYPRVIFHFDYAGLNLSKIQAGLMKRIQGSRGYPDLIILEPRGKYHAMFIEVKIEKTNILSGRTKNGFSSTHIEEQYLFLESLREKGYYAEFGKGTDNIIKQIDDYLSIK